MNDSRAAGSQCWASSTRLSASGSEPAGWSCPGPQASGMDERPSQGGPGKVASMTIRRPSTAAVRRSGTIASVRLAHRAPSRAERIAAAIKSRGGAPNATPARR
jgi:hypothetical protein